MTCMLKLSENIGNLRRKKKITQEELADFIGVTKAAVSKWETGQSLPDILVLPQLAVYFDVTADELLGYEAQLSKEQIQKLYAGLAADYARLPFEEVMEKTEGLVRRYYSCYPFLVQIGGLWLNHFMLAQTKEQQLEILGKGSGLCGHVMKNCRELPVCNDATILKAMFDLQLGKAAEVAAQLEEVTDPVHMWRQADGLLAQAYLAAGECEKAISYTQIRLYTHLLSLVGASTQYLAVSMDRPEACEETIQRAEGIMRLYDLNTLHPNCAAQFYYQAALTCLAQGKKKLALEKLSQYGEVVRYLLDKNHAYLHGDAYFDRLEEWIEKLELGAMPPRNITLVARSVMQTLDHPLFGALAGDAEFERIKKSLEEGVKRYE